MYLSASAYYDRAVKIMENTIGPNHPETADIKSDMAWILLKQGRLSEAEEIYKNTLIIRESIYGKEHPQVRNF